MEGIWIWIKENAGILVLINIFICIIIFLFQRWQGYEQGQDLREFLYVQAIARRGHGTYIEEKALEGSKHKWTSCVLSSLNFIYRANLSF